MEKGRQAKYAVIYINGDPADAAELREWAADFDADYNVGVGIKIPGAFDGFAPADSGSVELIIDALENIEFVNWT